MAKKILLATGETLFTCDLASRYSSLTAVLNRHQALWQLMQLFTKEEILKAVFGTWVDLRKAFLQKVVENVDQKQKLYAEEKAAQLFDNYCNKYGYQYLPIPKGKPNEPETANEPIIDTERPITGGYDDTPYKNDVISMNEDFSFTFNEAALNEKKAVYISDPIDIQKYEKAQKVLKDLNSLFGFEPGKTAFSERVFNTLFVFDMDGIKWNDHITLQEFRNVVKL